MMLTPCVADPDPYVFEPPGSRSGSISLRYGSGSGFGSFYHQAKIIRKTLIPSALWLLFDFLYLKNDVNVPSKSNKKNFFQKIIFLLASWRSMTKITGSASKSGSEPRSWSISHRHGSADPDPDPDPHQNVMDPQHCLIGKKNDPLFAVVASSNDKKMRGFFTYCCSFPLHCMPHWEIFSWTG